MSPTVAQGQEGKSWLSNVRDAVPGISGLAGIGFAASIFLGISFDISFYESHDIPLDMIKPLIEEYALFTDFQSFTGLLYRLTLAEKHFRLPQL